MGSKKELTWINPNQTKLSVTRGWNLAWFMPNFSIDPKSFPAGSYQSFCHKPVTLLDVLPGSALTQASAWAELVIIFINSATHPTG